jgi:hypothetical protein
MRVTRILVAAAALVAAVPVSRALAGPSDRLPSITQIFAAVYPDPEQAVTWEGQTYRVRFAPAALYEIGSHMYALVSRGAGSNSCPGCQGFYKVTYVEDEPQLRRLTTPLVGHGSDARRGDPPLIRPTAPIDTFVTLQVESNSLRDGVSQRWADLIRFGQTPEVVARGVPLAFEARGCRILGAIQPVARDKTFTVAYHGSWRGEARYSWDGSAWRPAEPGFDLQSKCRTQG